MLAPLSLTNPLADACAATDASFCGLFTRVTGNQDLARTLEVVLAPVLKLALIVLFAVLIRRWLHRLIDRTVSRVTAGDDGSSAMLATRRALRARTLASVLQSVTTAIVFGVAALMALQEVGVPVAPLLASAGVLGVAVGFGAQSLVKDVLSGMFMIVEDQYGVGDVIDVGNGISGVVEAVGLRVTRLRDVNGTVWFVRNGEILRVGNESQGWSRAVVDIRIAPSTNVAHAQDVLAEEGSAMREDPRFSEAVLADPEVWGIESWDKDGLVIRVVVKTQPLQQWPVARELRRRVNARFEAEGITVG